MPVNAQTIQQARDAGYDDAKIRDYIVKSPEYGTARKAGYSDPQIFDHLGFKATESPKKSGWDTAKAVVAEPFKLAGEAVAAPINAVVKAGKGYKGLYATGKSLLSGEGVDTAMQKGTEAIGNRNAIQSPLGQSATGNFLGEKVIQPGVNMLSKATGQPELVQGGVEAAGDIASLFGIKPGLKAVSGVGKNMLKKVADTQLPEKLYASAVKLPLSKAWTKQIGEEGITKRKMAVKAGLEGEVPPTEVGIAKAKNLEKSYRGVVDSAVSDLDGTGSLISKERLKSGLAEAYKVAGTEGTAAAQRIVDNLGKRFDKMGTLVKVGEKEIPDTTSGGMRTVPVYERKYTPSETQAIKRHLYKMENYERQQLSRGLASQLKELGNKGMAHEAKLSLEELNPELKALNQQDAAYINLVEALERSVPRIQNRDMMGLGAKILLTGSRPGAAILELISGAPRVKAATAFALNRARKIQKTAVGKEAAKATAAGVAKSATTPPEPDKWQTIGEDEQ